MQPMSQRWMPAMLADSLHIATQGQIWTPPSPSQPNGIMLTTFQVTLGQVVIDSTNAIRRTAQTITLVPFEMDKAQGVPLPVTTPDIATDVLFPDGNELVMLKGCRYDDGTPEYAQLGRFLMEDVEIYNASSDGALYIELNGRDRGGTIDRAGFTVPYSTDGISTLDVQLTDLIRFVAPYLPLNIAPSAFVPAQMVFHIGDSPWTSALALAASGGYELFPDAYGVITGRPVLDPTTLPVSVVYSTDEDSITTSIQRSQVTTGIPNVIISTSQGSNIPVPLISYWWDSNPNSPGYYSPDVPKPGSNMVSLPARDPASTYPTTVSATTTAAATTQEQNDNIVQAQGYASAGLYEAIDMKIRDNPAHDVEDVIGLFEPLSTVTPKKYILNTITVQMDFSTEMEMKGQLVTT